MLKLRALLPAPARLLFTGLVLLALAAGIACASGTPTGTPTPSPPPVGKEPIDVVRATLTDINNGNIDAAYANLSTDARKDVSLDQARRVITGLRSSGIKISVEINSIGQQTIGDQTASIELALTVHVGETAVPVNDAASLVKENGVWKVADHFLQSALAAVGLASPVSSGPRELDSKGCAIGDPMNGVYAPRRLKILDPCITVTGTVRNDITHAEDGDVTFGLILGPQDQRLVNSVNQSSYGGALHIEIVPLDQERVKTPQVGQKVTITGPWVTDLDHGHNEIHPAFVITVLQ